MAEEGSTVCLRAGDPCAELVEPDPEALIAAERCKAEGVDQAVRRSWNAPEKVETHRSMAGQTLVPTRRQNGQSASAGTDIAGCAMGTPMLPIESP